MTPTATPLTKCHADHLDGCADCRACAAEHRAAWERIERLRVRLADAERGDATYAQAVANDTENDALRAESERLQSALAEATAERNALQAFKAYVHKRLDDAAVPHDPEPAENAKHGCRIEGRLNFVLGRVSEGERAADAFNAERIAAMTACDDALAQRDACATDALALRDALGAAFEDTRAPVAQLTPERRQTLDEQDETHRLLSVARHKMLVAFNAPSPSAEVMAARLAEARAAALEEAATELEAYAARLDSDSTAARAYLAAADDIRPSPHPAPASTVAPAAGEAKRPTARYVLYRTAKWVHTCSRCGGEISKGSRYADLAGGVRACLPCAPEKGGARE